MAAADRDRWDARHEVAGPDPVGPPDGADQLSLPSGGTVLDVACGRGGHSVWAAPRGMAVVALDVSPVAVRATTLLAEAHGVGDMVDARVVDLEDGLPAGIGSFDLILCQRYRQPDLVGPMARALAPRGWLLASVLSVVGAENPGRFHAPAGELEDLVRVAGLTVEHSSEADGLAVVVARR